MEYDDHRCTGQVGAIEPINTPTEEEEEAGTRGEGKDKFIFILALDTVKPLKEL